MRIQRQSETFSWRTSAWELPPHSKAEIDDNNPDLTRLADLPETNGRWAYPYRGVSHVTSGSKMHVWGINPTDAPATHDTHDVEGHESYFYDPNHASVYLDKDLLEQGISRTRLNVHDSNRLGDIQGKEPGTIWRGMSDEEYQKAKQQGYFESNGAANFTELGQTGTCFSDDPDTSCSYASNYAPFQYMPTFTRPGHVIGIRDQGYPRNSVNEIEVPGRVPFSALTHHYQGNVRAISAGQFRGYQDPRNSNFPEYNGFDKKPSRGKSPSIYVNWSPQEIGQPHTTATRLASEDYHLQHQAPGPQWGYPLHDMDVGEDWYDHPEWYSGDHSSVTKYEMRHAQQMYRQAQGNPELPVTIYRALPPGHTHFNTGDWVTPSLNYARGHAIQNENPDDDWPVIKSTVPAKHLWQNGDSYHEMGYHGPSHHGQVV